MQIKGYDNINRNDRTISVSNTVHQYRMLV